MNIRNIVLSTVAGLLGNLRNLNIQKQNYSKRRVRVNTYKTGGKSFTKGKRSIHIQTLNPINHKNNLCERVKPKSIRWIC